MNAPFTHWRSLIERDAPIRVVFDVGANTGQTLKRFRSAFPESHIYSFEPGKDAFAGLLSAAADDPLAHPFQIALGERDGEAILHENSHSATNSILPNSSHINTYAPAEMCTPIGESVVSLKRLDSFCREHALEHIDILKIDAQGYERFILEGAGEFLRPDRIRAITLEVLFVDLYQNQTWCGQILELLRDHGYRLFAFDSIHAEPAHGWKWADALFIGNPAP